MAEIMPPPPTDPTRPTPDEVEALLLAALKAGDIPGVGIALRILAGIDPRRASLLYDTLSLGVEIARRD